MAKFQMTYTPLVVSFFVAISVAMQVLLLFRQETASIVKMFPDAIMGPPPAADEEVVLPDYLAKRFVLKGKVITAVYMVDGITRSFYFEGIEFRARSFTANEAVIVSGDTKESTISMSNCRMTAVHTTTETKIAMDFKCPGLLFEWSAEIETTDDYEVLRVGIKFKEGLPADRTVTLLQLFRHEDTLADAAEYRQALGSGIPLSGSDWWMSFEHPRAKNTVRDMDPSADEQLKKKDKEITKIFESKLLVSATPIALTASFGVSRKPALVSSFAKYIERYRPLQPLVFFDSSYELRNKPCDSILPSEKLTSAQCSMMREESQGNIDQLMEESKPLFVLLTDDWDDVNSKPWRPRFELKGKTAGLRISPATGGKERADHLFAEGPIKELPLKLSESNYYKWIGDLVKDLSADVPFLLFDDIEGLEPTDTDAYLVLVKDLPKAFLDTDTWRSPWLLKYFHALWRGGPATPGSDASISSDIQSLRNFRDAFNYKLYTDTIGSFPLRRVIDGFIWTQTEVFANLLSPSAFADEVEYFFQGGHLVRRMLTQQSLLDKAHHNIIVEHAEKSAALMKDLHATWWIGQDPAKGPYGLFSADMDARNAFLRLRNPHHYPTEVMIDSVLLTVPTTSCTIREPAKHSEEDIQLPVSVTLNGQETRSFKMTCA